MATITALSTSLQSITATGPVTPTAGVSVAGMTGDAMVCLEIVSMTAGKTARIQLEDSVNAFTASNALWVQDVTGQMGQGTTAFAQGAYNPTTDKRTVRKYQLPNSNIGVASGVVRLNVTVIDGSAELVMNAWIEN
jgi:ABC-type transport system involved in cytochrome bd biosynthesis fused ATPase/permease subunit